MLVEAPPSAVEPPGLATRVERWAAVQPDVVAVCHGDRSLTYRQLDLAGDVVADLIDAAGSRSELPSVAIVYDQSLEAVVMAVAVSRSGRAAVPVDVHAPPSRLAHMFELVGPVVVLTDREHRHLVDAAPGPSRAVVEINDATGLPPAPGDVGRSSRAVDPEDPSLIVFTSGSTGVPKGVVRSQASTAAMIANRIGDERFGPGRRVAQVLDFQWVAGWGAILDALGTGATLCLYATRRDGVAGLAGWLRDERIHSVAAVPSLVQATLDAMPAGLDLPDLQWVALSGDVLHRSLVEQLLARMPPQGRIRHTYASSEAGGIAMWLISRETALDGDVVPVGTPRPDVTVEIDEPDVDGVGEIVVTSRRVALGYLRATGDSRVGVSGDPGRRRYRTGDLGRIRPDGLLELRGRTDDMVKVRGHRVELGEVERALRDLGQVRDAAAGIDSSTGRPRLVAWVVGEADGDLGVSTLRTQLRKRLPGYMVPAAFVELDELPRGGRGKLDRAGLPAPAPGRPDLGVAYEAPVGDVEQLVATAYERVLGVEPVGRHDAFFDLGGDSLLAAEAMTAISASLGHDLPLSVFVEAATPAELARRLGHDEPAAGRFVELQPDGRGPTVYCVHGGGGQVLSFAALATRLGRSRPFVGVQLGATDKARDLFRVRALARRYAEEIERSGQARPCVVAGHSYGGIVAFELARQLEARAVPVRACVILDCAPPSPAMLVGRVPLGQVVAGDLDAVDRAKELAYAAHALAGLTPRPYRVTTERMVAALWGMGLYRPRPVASPVAVVRARGGAGGRDLEAWRAVARGPFRLLEVPGDHHSILSPPHLHTLAEQLLDLLDEWAPAP